MILAQDIVTLDELTVKLFNCTSSCSQNIEGLFIFIGDGQHLFTHTSLSCAKLDAIFSTELHSSIKTVFVIFLSLIHVLHMFLIYGMVLQVK